MDYLQPNDWSEIASCLEERVRTRPHSVYHTALLARFVRTRDICQPVFEYKPRTQKKKRKKK
jgi:hypothetical protein